MKLPAAAVPMVKLFGRGPLIEIVGQDGKGEVSGTAASVAPLEAGRGVVDDVMQWLDLVTDDDEHAAVAYVVVGRPLADVLFFRCTGDCVSWFGHVCICFLKRGQTC